MIELSVSNILNRKGFGLDNLDDFLSLLKKNGISAVELALNCVFLEPADISEHEFNRLRRMLDKHSIKVAALHSLTFSRPELELFNNVDVLASLVAYVSAYVPMARKLNCNNIVFGSGKARKIHGKSREECDTLFKVFLGEIDSISEDVFFNIEPLPESFCEYMNSYSHAFEILNTGNFKNIGIQLDLKALFETNSFHAAALLANKDYFHHVHVSNMDFSPPSKKDIDKHCQMEELLTDIGFSGFVSMEAVTGNPDISPTEIKEYLKIFKNIYSM